MMAEWGNRIWALKAMGLCCTSCKLFLFKMDHYPPPCLPLLTCGCLGSHGLHIVTRLLNLKPQLTSVVVVVKTVSSDSTFHHCTYFLLYMILLVRPRFMRLSFAASEVKCPKQNPNVFHNCHNLSLYSFNLVLALNICNYSLFILYSLIKGWASLLT